MMIRSTRDDQEHGRQRHCCDHHGLTLSPSWPSLLLLLLLSSAAAAATSSTSTKAYYKNCGENAASSINEIHGCNLQLEEEQSCSFSDYYDSAKTNSAANNNNGGGDSELALSLARPNRSNDDRMVTLYYYTCTVRSSASNDCTDVETVPLYGNALVRIDDMLIQRQPQSQSAATTTTTAPASPQFDNNDRICFVWDHLDGNAPQQLQNRNNCQYECLPLTSANFNQEIMLQTDTSHGLPNYGSVTRNRHVTIVETGVRSDAAAAAGRTTRTTMELLFLSTLLMVTFTNSFI